MKNFNMSRKLLRDFGMKEEINQMNEWNHSKLFWRESGIKVTKYGKWFLQSV